MGKETISGYCPFKYLLENKVKQKYTHLLAHNGLQELVNLLNCQAVAFHHLQFWYFNLQLHQRCVQAARSLKKSYVDTVARGLLEFFKNEINNNKGWGGWGSCSVLLLYRTAPPPLQCGKVTLPLHALTALLPLPSSVVK